MDATPNTNRPEEVTMSTAITLSNDLHLKGSTVPAGTVLVTNDDELRRLWVGIKMASGMTQTLSCQHPTIDGALLAVPSSHIADYRDVLQQASAIAAR